MKKELWEMTQLEAWKKEPKIGAPDRPGVLWMKKRKQQIKQALSEGKPVPAEVLAEVTP